MNTPCTLSDVPGRRKASHPHVYGKLLSCFLRLIRRIVADDLPSLRRHFKDKQKVTIRVASPGRCALQVKVSRRCSKAFIERLYLKPRETEHAHLLLGGVDPAIAVEHLGIATVHPRTDKENVRRILVARREGIHVPTIPIDDLLVQHSANGLSRRSALRAEKR